MITIEQFKMLDDLYVYYNNELFNGKLNDCMIITSRKKGSKGHFAHEIWKNKKDEKKMIHEISLNPDFLDRADELWQSTLVHEMTHLWQRDHGKPSRTGYHNKQWAEKMEEIGLMPTDTGSEGGKKTGQKMTHYIMPNGAFIQAFKKLKDKNIKYISSSMLGENKKSSAQTQNAKTKYTCSCGNNVWGKSGLFLTCGICENDYKEELKNDNN